MDHTPTAAKVNASRRAPRIDAWSWPSGLADPAATTERQAGAAVLRFPDTREDAPAFLLRALREGARNLAAMPVRDLIASLGLAGEALGRSLDAGAADEVAANAGLAPAMVRTVLAETARSWTREALERLVRKEFGDARVLDEFVADGGRRVRAKGPPVVLHLGSGSVPGVTATSIVRAMLVKSAVLAKPGAGDVALTVRFAEILRAQSPAAASALAVQYWPGGDPAWGAWERGIFAAADQVVVYGSDAAIASVRARAPARTRLVEHAHRIGVAIVNPAGSVRSAAHAARAAALFDQRGCVSAHVFFVLGAPQSAAQWCDALAQELDDLARDLPPGPPTLDEASAVQQVRGRLALKAAAGEDVRVWTSRGLEWTVALAGIADFAPSGGRTAWVVAVPDRDACLAGLATLRGAIQTIGLAGVSLEDGDFEEALFKLGATRIAPLERMSFPDAAWLHDGRRPLRELVVWGERT